MKSKISGQTHDWLTHTHPQTHTHRHTQNAEAGMKKRTCRAREVKSQYIFPWRFFLRNNFRKWNLNYFIKVIVKKSSEHTRLLWGFPGGSNGKESACNAGDLDLIPGSGRSPGEGKGDPLQCSCLDNSMDRGAWWATVHGVAKSPTQLSDFTFFHKMYCKTTTFYIYFTIIFSMVFRNVQSGLKSFNI